jgi:aldehyde:ferredoxin oxidoreductase
VETAAFNKIQDTVDLVNAATGLGYDLKSMIDTGHRIWYIKRAFANLCGATRDDDQVPKRIIEPHLEGPVSSLNMALYPTYITMYPITWFFTNQKIMKLATPAINLALPVLRLLPGFKEVQDIHGLYEKLMGITAGMANAFLFPNINKILRALRFIPGMRAVDPKAPEAVKRTVPFQQMLEEFYRLRDIDQQGRPSQARLESLGMKDVAEALHG